jgi:hypothetical protein
MLFIIASVPTTLPLNIFGATCRTCQNCGSAHVLDVTGFLRF